MRGIRNLVLAGAAVVLVAGAAVAATGKLNTMTVALPGGSVAQIEYAGDIAPKVMVLPATAMNDPFAELDRMSAQMEQQRAALMQQVAEMQRQAASGAAQPGQFVVTGNMPAGSSYQYTVVSSSSGKGNCTQTVEWRSDGSGKEPQVTRASSGDCDAVKPSEKAIPAAAQQREAPVDPRSI